MSWLELDWNLIGHNLVFLGVAYLLALPIGWERERRHGYAGLRTFPLVAVAACANMLIAQGYFETEESLSRVLQGLLTGIGFIGGGVILKSEHNIRGVATAASIWATGAIGVAVALKRLEIALVLSVLTLLTLRFLEPWKERIRRYKGLSNDD